MKILHFSDLHLQDTLPTGLAWLVDKRVLGTVTQHLRRAHRQNLQTIPRLLDLTRQERPDAIVCTGDLTAVALPGEFDRAREALTPFKKLVPPGNFIFIPGNHDRYIDRAEAREALRLLERYLNDDTDEIEFNVIRRKLEQVSCYLLDAARPRPFWSSGGVAQERQLTCLRRMTEGPTPPGELRMLVSHFPLWDKEGNRLCFRRRMERDRELWKLLREHRFAALLCGHIHTPFVRNMDGIMQICPGSLTLHHQAAFIETRPDAFTVRMVDVLANRQQTFTPTSPNP